MPIPMVLASYHAILLVNLHDSLLATPIILSCVCLSAIGAETGEACLLPLRFDIRMLVVEAEAIRLTVAPDP